MLDTETTSADPEQAQVASICRAVIDISTKSKDVQNALIAVEMPAEASAVNGLTTEKLMADGKPPADVLDEYCAELAAVLMLGQPIIIANAPYDLTVLDRECRRNGVPTIEDRLGGRALAPILDPICLDKKVAKFRRRVSPTQGARCLKTLAQVHGVGWDDELAHTAEYDALQAGRVVWQLMRRYPLLADMTLNELHIGQVGWYAEQAESLAQFFRRSANEARHSAEQAGDAAEQETLLADAEALSAKAESVSLDWPVRPFGIQR
ncbi:DNA polymerase-3 subunit epsilon [Actinoplanes campanulatus]|uniref:DNA polymerase-3 subunit epsilon n=1 Tax=Actinoplanes campanulatus TaxID=113559 RepID=A0A7W5AMN3_9ACTN|nr:exonuclease domain-containing protein [Actinoplanes campanulatus]MBB3098940.1 DNA polymerase-3 subunit epsilon [Actinoplanes campanulatus]